MTLIRSVFLIFTIIVTALPASAWDGVESLEASGYITRWFTLNSSPTPRYCDWRTADPPGPIYSATNADGVGNNDCTDPWFVHCDRDSMVYRGSWPGIDARLVYSSHYEAVFACSINISQTTFLSASRSVEGNLTSDIHVVEMEYPDGSMVSLLAAGSGPDQVERMLEPGSYQIFILVDAYQSNRLGDFIDPYQGFIVLTWQDPARVAVEPMSWGSMKAIFR